MQVAVIGGSGFYELVEGQQFTVKTPFGESSPIIKGEVVGGHPIHFMTRHGAGHTLPPHLVNYRANIFALHTLGTTRILTSNAVGSCNADIQPGDFVVPDQLIDFTQGRKSTFFEGSAASPNIPDKLRVLKHTDVTHPYKGDARQALMAAMADKGIVFHSKGVYVSSNGPRFETAAEVKMLAIVGGDLLGMTSAPEVFLARELGMDYATLCLVTNMGAGLQKTVTHDEVIEIFNSQIEVLKDVVLRALDILHDVSKR